MRAEFISGANDWLILLLSPLSIELQKSPAWVEYFWPCPACVLPIWPYCEIKLFKFESAPPNRAEKKPLIENPLCRAPGRARSHCITDSTIPHYFFLACLLLHSVHVGHRPELGGWCWIAPHRSQRLGVTGFFMCPPLERNLSPLVNRGRGSTVDIRCGC